MTTPDTAAVRAWARENGFDIGDRGRIPAEVQDAYRAEHGGAGTASARKAPAAKPRTAKPAAKTPAKSARSKSAPSSAGSTPDGTPGPKPSPVADDRRLVALGEQLAALTKRVEVLESAAGSKSSSSGKTSRFRRSRS